MPSTTKLRKVTSLGTAAAGAFALLAPKKAAVVGDKLKLAPFYDDVRDAEMAPRDWYVDATRSSGAGMLAAGLTGFLLATRAEASDEDGQTDSAESENRETAFGSDDGPVEIDLDDAEDVTDD